MRNVILIVGLICIFFIAGCANQTSTEPNQTTTQTTTNHNFYFFTDEFKIFEDCLFMRFGFTSTPDFEVEEHTFNAIVREECDDDEFQQPYSSSAYELHTNGEVFYGWMWVSNQDVQYPNTKLVQGTSIAFPQIPAEYLGDEVKLFIDGKEKYSFERPNRPKVYGFGVNYTERTITFAGSGENRTDDVFGFMIMAESEGMLQGKAFLDDSVAAYRMDPYRVVHNIKNNIWSGNDTLRSHVHVSDGFHMYRAELDLQRFV